MAVWPASLQDKVDADTFGLRIGETVLRSDMDTGPAKLRRRITKSVDVITCSIHLTVEQYQTFMDFFDIDLNGGVNTFEFANPITQVVETYRFMTPPDFKPIGGVNFTVNMQWERLP